MKKMLLSVLCLTTLCSLGANGVTSQSTNNLIFLFSAYLVLWLGFFVYVIFLKTKQKDLQSEIEQLQVTLDKS